MTWGRIYLWIAILIFAAAASVVARLVEIGEANLIDGRNPISFCNLLFAGNLVAALTLLALYHREWRPARLRYPIASAMADPDGLGPYLRRNSPGHDVYGHRPYLRHQHRPN